MKIFELINFFSQKYHQRGFWGLIKRAYSKIITNNFIYFDEYLNNIKFHFKSKKKDNYHYYFPNRKISNLKKFDDVHQILVKIEESWKKKLSKWNYDVKNKIYFPVVYKKQFEYWLIKNKKIGLDFMSVNERTKLNHILFWALCFQVTKKNYYLDYIYDELVSFKKVYKFGKGVAYYTTLNVSQRLINLSFTNNLLFKNKNYNKKLNFLIEKIMYSEFQYVCKQNTGFYLKRNNHYISELLSIICYLKCSVFKCKISLLKEYEKKFNEEIDLQMDKEGGTLEGSLAYSAYILEMLFIGYFLKITNNKDKLKLLYNWIKGMSNEEGILAGFGDVAPEKAINLNPDEKILNKSTLFNLIDFMLVSKTKYNLKKTYLEYFYLFYGKRVLNFKKVKFKNETILKKA